MKHRIALIAVALATLGFLTACSEQYERLPDGSIFVYDEDGQIETKYVKKACGSNDVLSYERERMFNEDGFIVRCR